MTAQSNAVFPNIAKPDRSTGANKIRAGRLVRPPAGV